jgi:DNA polymerase elongation subunit (family B)
LYGSLGLEIVTGVDFSPQDIDILVPKRFIDEDWPLLMETMEKLGYTLIDLHEHKFKKSDIEIGFAFEEDLLPFARVHYKKLEIITDQNVSYKLLSEEEYLLVYKESVKDSYRRTKNNNKDLKKIEILEKILS